MAFVCNGATLCRISASPIRSVCSCAFANRTSRVGSSRRSFLPEGKDTSRRLSTSVATMTVSEGATAPDFTANDTDGNEITLSSMRGSPVVLYFMAGIGMGCTTQSCAFRDAAAELSELEAKIIGVSSRSDGESFKSRNSLSYPIINDPDSRLQKLYGVPKTFGLIPGRFTFVIDKEGIVKKVYNSQFSASQHVEVAKAAVKAM